MGQFVPADRASRSSALMFIATIFAAFDAALDTQTQDLAHSQGLLWVLALFVSGWLINVIAVLLAVYSMHRFLLVLKILLEEQSNKKCSSKTILKN
jgi:uncharacterized membrane protein